MSSNIEDRKELEQVLKFLNLTEEQFNLTCEVAYNKVIKNRANADFQKKKSMSESENYRQRLSAL